MAGVALKDFMTRITTRGILLRSTSVWMWDAMLAKSVQIYTPPSTGHTPSFGNLAGH